MATNIGERLETILQTLSEDVPADKQALLVEAAFLVGKLVEQNNRPHWTIPTFPTPPFTPTVETPRDRREYYTTDSTNDERGGYDKDGNWIPAPPTPPESFPGTFRVGGLKILTHAGYEVATD